MQPLISRTHYPKEMLTMSTPTHPHTISRPQVKPVLLSLIVLVLSLGMLLFALPPGSGLRPAWGQSSTEVFTFAGDFGTGSGFTANLNKILPSGSNFFIANGDLGYFSGSGSEAGWCNSVKNVVGATFPFELETGNHDQDGNGGFIRN